PAEGLSAAHRHRGYTSQGLLSCRGLPSGLRVLQSGQPVHSGLRPSEDRCLETTVPGVVRRIQTEKVTPPRFLKPGRARNLQYHDKGNEAYREFADRREGKQAKRAQRENGSDRIGSVFIIGVDRPLRRDDGGSSADRRADGEQAGEL